MEQQVDTLKDSTSQSTAVQNQSNKNDDTTKEVSTKKNVEFVNITVMNDTKPEPKRAVFSCERLRKECPSQVFEMFFNGDSTNSHGTIILSGLHDDVFKLLFWQTLCTTPDPSIWKSFPSDLIRNLLEAIYKYDLQAFRPYLKHLQPFKVTSGKDYYPIVEAAGQLRMNNFIEKFKALAFEDGRRFTVQRLSSYRPEDVAEIISVSRLTDAMIAYSDQTLAEPCIKALRVKMKAKPRLFKRLIQYCANQKPPSDLLLMHVMPEFGVSNAQRSYAKEILLCAKSWKMHDFAKAFKEKNAKTFEPPDAPKRRLEEKKPTTPDAKRQKLDSEKKYPEKPIGSNPRTPERRHVREKVESQKVHGKQKEEKRHAVENEASVITDDGSPLSVVDIGKVARDLAIFWGNNPPS